MTDLGVQSFPASIEIRATEEKLLDMVRKRVGDGMLETNPPVFWSAEISNTNLDSYFTHMQPSSLKNYAREAKAGVPFQDSHMTNGLSRTFGRSLTGEYSPLDDTKFARVSSDFYTLQGLDPDTDSFINKMRAGLVNDVSIGFMPGEFICSICGRDAMTWDITDWENNCWHYAGFSYPKGDSRDKDAEKILCTYAVENATLVEVSAVYAGSTPGASIKKAERMLSAGKLPHDVARKLEHRYNVRLLGAANIFLPATTGIQEDRMGEKQEPIGEAAVQAPVPEPVVEDRIIETPPEPVVTPNELDAVRVLIMSKGLLRGTLAESVRALIDENVRLQPLADDGVAYRKDMIDGAIAEGIRAWGSSFKTETYRGMMETLSIDIIKQMRSDWSAVATASIPTGRKTQGEGESSERTVETNDSRRYKA